MKFDYKLEMQKKLAKKDEILLAYEKLSKAASLLDNFGFSEEAAKVDELFVNDNINEEKL